MYAKQYKSFVHFRVNQNFSIIYIFFKSHNRFLSDIFQVLSNNTYIHISENVVNATVQSFAEMRCPLIDEKTVNMSGLYVEEFSVSVSYNRHNYSQHMRLNVFDGNCHNINQVSLDNVVELMVSILLFCYLS